MNLSIVITTFNRADVLKRLLSQLDSQNDQTFDVVVAIDGSTDHTEAMLRECRTSYPLSWINTHCQGYGLAVARNQGILAAQGPAVVIIDDDSMPSLNFVSAHKSSCSEGVITGGPRRPAGDDERMAWKMRELAKLPPCTPMTIEQMQIEWPNAYLVENNICLFRDDWIAMGLFSERLKLYGYIGQEFFARAHFLGIHYQYNPDAWVVHHAEHEGDNGLMRSHKERQVLWSTLIRPSLMTPRHYHGQIAWAKAKVNGAEISQPSYVPHVALTIAWRAARMLAADLRHKIKLCFRRIA